MAIQRVPYRTSLRVIGHLLNGDRARMATVCEIDQGFMLHYFQGGDVQRVSARAMHSAEVLDLDDTLRKGRGRGDTTGALGGFKSLMGLNGDARRFQKSHPLCPMGYEDVLRALGAIVDRRNAHAVAVSELDDCLLLEYTIDRADFVIRHGQRMAIAGRRQESFTAPQLAELVAKERDDAVERVRSSGQQLAHNPMDISSFLSAATVLEDHGQAHEAEDLYLRALDAAPHHPEVHYHLARHARLRGEHKGAVKHLVTAIEHNAKDGRYYHLLGRLYLERNRAGEAAQALQHAVVCEPDNRVYHFHLDQALERLGGHGGRKESAKTARGGMTAPPQDVVNEFWLAPSGAPDVPAGAAASVTAASTAKGPALLPADHVAAEIAPDWGIASDQAQWPEPVSVEAGLFASPGRHATEEESANLFAPIDSPFALPSVEWEKPLPFALPAHRPVPAAEADTGQESADALVAGLPVLGLAQANDWVTPATENDWSTSASENIWATSTPDPVALFKNEESVAGLPSTAFQSADEPEESQFAGLAATADPITPADEALNLTAAILKAEEMVRAEPHRADLHRKLGFLLAKQGRNEDAAAAFRRAVECGRKRLAS